MGPFTGGQLTVVIVTFAVLLLFPLGAWAASSGVFITDSTGAHKANVTAAGNLKVDTGLSTFGLVPTVVTGGSVNATPASPSQLFRSSLQGATGLGVCTKVVDSNQAYPKGGGGTKAEIITEISAGVQGHVGAFWQLHRTSNCSDPAVVGFYITAQPGTNASNYANVQHHFPSGLALPTGQGLYVFTSSSDVSVDLSATGYLVPSSAVPANG